MESDAKGRAALLAAVSALGLSLGVTIPSHAKADESPKENRYAKPQSQYVKGESQHIKGESQQLKLDSHQLKLDSAYIKHGPPDRTAGGSNQIKIDSRHIKGESQQMKYRTTDKTSPQ